MSRDEIIAIAEAYLNGLAKKDLSNVPFAADITFEGPQVPKLVGRQSVVGFVTTGVTWPVSDNNFQRRPHSVYMTVSGLLAQARLTRVLSVRKCSRHALGCLLAEAFPFALRCQYKRRLEWCARQVLASLDWSFRERG